MNLAKKYNTGPDFNRLRMALLRGIPDRVPLQELVGSGNSVPAYVPFANYLAMVETTLRYGFNL